jgi:hypothetical protein
MICIEFLATRRATDLGEAQFNASLRMTYYGRGFAHRKCRLLGRPNQKPPLVNRSELEFLHGGFPSRLLILRFDPAEILAFGSMRMTSQKRTFLGT